MKQQASALEGVHETQAVCRAVSPGGGKFSPLVSNQMGASVPHWFTFGVGDKSKCLILHVNLGPVLQKL